MRALVILGLLFVASCFAATAPTVATVSTYASFKDLKPTGNNYQYLSYVTNKTWTPSNQIWDCSNVGCTPGKSGCGTSSATKPQCLQSPAIPSPSTADATWDLATWPWQVRWGNAQCCTAPDTGIPSGFGFKGNYNQAISTIYDTFWVGEAVHFNNVIDSGTAAGGWTLVLELSITWVGQSASVTEFTFPLTIDETTNSCSGNGCPWVVWPNYSLDTNPNCPTETNNAKFKNGTACCAYYSVKYACADRIKTLAQIVQNSTILINGKLYTLFIQGFSVPGNQAVQKTYFISQENGKTQAEIYGNLVDACPSSCPSGQAVIISPDGKQCQCNCTNANDPCPSGQSRGADCNCACNADAIQCNGGSVVTTAGDTCACDCAGVSCTGSQVQNSADCSCSCPANYCNNSGVAVKSTGASGCACQCPACAVTGQVADAFCNCACPQTAVDNCNKNGGTLNADCTCTIGCSCFNTTCRSVASCDTTSGVCTYSYHGDGTACDAPDSQDLCQASCQAGLCVYSAVECTETHTGNDAVCFNPVCDTTKGTCSDVPVATATPTLDNLVPCGDAAYVASLPECVTAACTPSGCGSIPVADGLVCKNPTVGTVDQCNKAQCIQGTCTVVPTPGQTCDDGNPCTFYNNTVDVTGNPADLCVQDTGAPTATCQSNNQLCSEQIQCNNVTCVPTVAGAFCVATPLLYGTACDDGFLCTTNDVCGRFLQADENGNIGWVDSGVCEGVAVQCETGDACVVGRCLEGGGCVNRTDVRDDFICGVSADNCTIYRCDNGTCLAADDLCPGHSSNKGAIIGASIAGAAALAAAAAIAVWARNRAATSAVFDPMTWDQLAAGAGSNSPIYAPNTREYSNSIYSGSNGAGS